jgi:hypothetical protein
MSKWNTVITERRFKVLEIPATMIAKLFAHPDSDHVHCLWSDDLPQEAMVTGMAEVRGFDSIAIRFAHPSFDPVPIGGEPPTIICDLFTFSLAKELPETGGAAETAAKLRKNLDDWGYNGKKADR